MSKRITYANVVATLALVLSMTGGAIAASHYLINSTKQINPKVLKKLKGATGRTGAAGAKGATGATGANGASGTVGKDGAPGSAVAYAHVNSNGTLDDPNSKNIASGNVSEPFPGVYCFSGLSFVPHNPTANIDWQSTANGVVEEITVAIGSSAQSLCESPSAQASVLTAKVNPGTSTVGLSRAFYIAFN